jgi:prepilin-type N-terminal cleavage/methylation domain-containing protein
MPKIRGFSLVELMIAVAIIAVITSIGSVVYTRITKSSEDAAKKAKVESVAKVYEIGYDALTASYKPLADSDFSNNKKPLPGEVIYQEGPDAASPTPSRFTVCATLSDGSLYCRSSAQATAFILNPTFTPTPTATPIPTVAATPTTAPPTATPTPSLSTGLASYWNMDETSGILLDDSVGSNNGTNGNSGGSVPGKIGQARYMTGGSFISIGAATNLRNPPFTISAWVAFENLADQAVIFSHAAGGNDGGYVFLKSTSGEGSLFTLARSPGPRCTSASGIGSNAFRHIVVTYDGSNCVFYIQGSYVSTAPLNANFSGTGGFIGSQNTNGGFLKGTIDEVGVWNRVLSATEVSRLYNGGAGLRP